MTAEPRASTKPSESAAGAEPGEILDSRLADQFRVFIREVIVHEDRDAGQGGEYDLRFGAAGDPDLPDNRYVARWTSKVVSGEATEVLGWVGPVTVSMPGGVLAVGCAGSEQDLLADDTVLGGVAVFDDAQQWGTGRWWRTVNGRHCDFVFAVVRGDAPEQPAPILLGDPTDAPGPADPTPDHYRAVFG
ncbi:MAG: hypothetical protein ACRDI2_23315 [Chloroflexota bacterium]